MLDIAIWVLTVEILGLAALPLLRSFFGNRRDAALLSRPIGLALVAWGGWGIAVVATGQFNRSALLLALLALAGISYRAHRRSAPERKDRASFFGSEEKRAAVLFWACAAFFFLLRAGFPEIFGQEKYMDLAFLNSLTRNAAMPPLDPWMAGHTINYYYWGYLLTAVLTKISGVPTPISYNLAIGTFAAYSFVAAACLGLRLSGGRHAAGLWSGIATVFGGNVVGAFDALRAPFGRGFDYWHASRVIAAGDTINEFPFFTFLQADLHPHLTAFPFFIAAFAIAQRLAEMPSFGSIRSARAAMSAAGPALLLVLTAGTARAANNWNLPAMALLFLFVGLLRARGNRPWPDAAAAFRGALLGGALVLTMLLLWAPYSKSYALPQPSLQPTTMKSDLLEFLGVWGVLFATGFLVLLPSDAGDEAARRRRDLGLAGVAAAALLIGLAEKVPALVVLVPLIALAARFAWRSLRRSAEAPSDLFLAFVLLLGLAMVAGCEFVYFKDSYGAQLQRMNTIFKFYHQAWPLFAIPLAVLGERAWTAAGAGSWRRAALAAAAVVLLLYPADALMWRIRQAVANGPTLNAWPAVVRRNAGDATAISWLSGNARRGAVVLEATGDAYSDYARVATHTGIPTVLGWANHESLWRGDEKEIPERIAAIRAVYSGVEPRTALAILQRYGVTHVVVGDLERRAYARADEVAAYPFLQPVASSGTTAVYRFFGTP